MSELSAQAEHLRKATEIKISESDIHAAKTIVELASAQETMLQNMLLGALVANMRGHAAAGSQPAHGR